MAKTNRKKSSSQSSGRKKKKKNGRGIFRKLLLALILLVVIAAVAWFFRDAFGAFSDQVRHRISETRQKLPTVTITPPAASPGTAGSPASAPPPRVQEQLIGRIVEVVDGDTIKIASGDTVFPLHIYGIDAPEVLQEYGTVARDILRDKVLDGEAEIQVITRRDGTRYGRVRYDGRDIAAEMVRGGHAWYDRSNARDEQSLADAEDAARRTKQGIWSVKNPTPPWEFRSRNH